MLVLIADRGLGGSSLDAQVIQISGSTAKPVADIAHGLAFGKLAEKHRHQMGPAGISLLVLIGLASGNQFVEGKAIQFGNNLRKQCYIYHQREGFFGVIATQIYVEIPQKSFSLFLFSPTFRTLLQSKLYSFKLSPFQP